MLRIAFICLLAPLLVAALATAAPAMQEAPRIGRPRPAPAGPSRLPPLPPAALDDTLAIEGDDIAARKKSSRLTVPVRVNGRGPYQFVVDSGADTSVVGVRIARELALPLGTPAVLNGMAARSLVARVKVDELALGGSSFQRLELPALRETDLGAAGMVGIDALVNQRLLMDFERLSIKVEDARQPSSARTENGDIVVVARRRRGQLILTEVRAGAVALEAVIDTGSEVTVGNSALRARLIRRGQEMTKAVLTDVAGRSLRLDMAVVPQIRIGSITLIDVPIAFADLPPFEAFGMADGPALLLGTDLLETFRRVSLDFRARRVRFQLRHCRTQSVSINTSPAGLQSRLSSDNPVACAR